jgi:hypothetical protein
MKLRAIESKWKAFTDGLRSRSDLETAGIILAERLKGCSYAIWLRSRKKDI